MNCTVCGIAAMIVVVMARFTFWYFFSYSTNLCITLDVATYKYRFFATAWSTQSGCVNQRDVHLCTFLIPTFDGLGTSSHDLALPLRRL